SSRQPPRPSARRSSCTEPRMRSSESSAGTSPIQSTHRHDLLQLPRVDILLEARELATPKAENVTHLSIEAVAGRFVEAGVAAFHYDVFASVVEPPNVDRETIPL